MGERDEMATDPWLRKDEWSHRADSFLVVVSRLSEPRPESRHDMGEHRWTVYAYVYPQHPLFAKFNPSGGMWGQPDLHGHWSPSLYRAHCDTTGSIKSHQLGWDYAHDGDSRFSFMATRNEASEVFWDAQKLYDELAGWTAREQKTSTTT